ncbi:TPA: hypothetical protein ACNRZI_005197, partial [Escherichia coli]
IDTNPLPIVIIKLRTKYIIPKNAGINAKYKKGIISDNLKKTTKNNKKAINALYFIVFYLPYKCLNK